ncbi:hypothetical protein DYB31_016020, partial [Aphanomyces astaci]
LHTFKFMPHVSLDVNLQAFDKMRTAVEKLEGRPLSDSHLASALLAALPECIAPDLFVWRGAQPSIPYKNMRQLLQQHWPSADRRGCTGAWLGNRDHDRTLPFHFFAVKSERGGF